MQTLASPLLAIIRLGSCHNVWCLRYSWQRCSVQYQWASSVPPPSNISMSNHARARDSPAVVSIQCWKWSQDSAQCQSIQLFVPDWCLLDSVTVSVAALIMAASFIGHIQTNIASTPCITSYNNHCNTVTNIKILSVSLRDYFVGSLHAKGEFFCMFINVVCKSVKLQVIG